MSEEQSTVVEKYLQQKGIRYQFTNGQCKVYECIYCHNENGKLYINAETWLHDCKACGIKGNERSLKKQLGDILDGISSSQDAARKHETVEEIPDIDAYHQALLEDDAVLNWLGDVRGFSLDVVKANKLGLATRKFGNHGNLKAITFPYMAAGHCLGVKYRTLPQSLDPTAPADKDFRFTQGKEVGLYNQDAITHGMEYLIHTEGEADVLTLLSAGEPNVVGVPGCENKKVTWDRLLDKPKKRYLLYDTDVVGQKGAYEFATRFGIERFYNIVLPEFDLLEPVEEKGKIRTKGKDIGEWLMAGHTLEELKPLMEAARPFDIEGVSGVDDALYECEQEILEKGSLEPQYKFFSESVNLIAGGGNDGDLTIVLAPPKVGKTTWCLNQADYSVDVENKTVFFDCGEMKPRQLARKWAALATKTNDRDMTVETFQQARRINQTRTADLLFGHATVTKEEEAFDRIRAAVRRYGAKIVIYDNLQLLADNTLGRGNMAHRTTYISMLTKKFKQLAMELNVWIILISQPKRMKDGEVANSDSTEGSSAPEKDCDTMICLHRNREARLNAKELESMGNLKVNENFSPKMFVRVDLSRYASGGVCTQHMEGAMSWVREYTLEEMKTTVPVVNSGAITVNGPSGVNTTEGEAV